MGKLKFDARKDELSSVGICRKDQGGCVLSQNENCVKLCGDRKGSVCTDGCMKGIDLGSKHPFARGIHIVPDLERHGFLTDAAVVNDGEVITTILYEKGDASSEQPIGSKKRKA